MKSHKAGLSAVLILLMGLCGCAGSAAPATPSPRLRGPDAAVMTRSERLPAPKAGEDAKQLLGQCRAAHGEALDKLDPLQDFARRVTRAR